MKKTIREKVDNAIRKRLKESLDENTKELIRAYESEQDEAKKVELKYAISEALGPIIISAILEQLAAMTDRRFSSFCKEWTEPLLEKAKEVGEEYLKYEMITRDPLVVLTEIFTLMERSESFGKKIERRIEPYRKDPKILERLLALLFIDQYAYRLVFSIFRPFFDILDVAKNKLGVDEKWLIANAALDLEENMLKKKLIELGLSVDEIEKLEYHDMVGKTIKLIERREGRQIGLDLLLTPGYRKVRNRFKHRGYEYRPTNEEIFNIIAHVVKLGKSIWKEK